MSKNPRPNKALDRDLKSRVYLENANTAIRRPLVAPALAGLFILIAVLAAASVFGFAGQGFIIAIAAGLGAYMALNIGANDVANNVGPAVGAGALSMGGALLIAAVFESAGALLAGGDVVGTISKGIIDPAAVGEPRVFIWAMMAALIASAVWVNLATWIGAPVSTTHSVVGGVMGAGIAAAGFAAVNWPTMGKIAASWVISPMLGGLIAALFLWFIKSRVADQQDKIAAARRWVPVLIAIMAGAFSAYLAVKGVKKIIKIDLQTAILIGLGMAALFYFVTRPMIKKQSEGKANTKETVRGLFTIPMIFSAALLSFAHGANDVANAVGPLAAIVHTAEAGDVLAKVSIPIWVMVVGAFGLSFGLLLFGPKLIRMVGQQITKLNPLRAYCVALSAAITVIVASWLGLPVSSTHIAVGAVFGVGFFREAHWRVTTNKSYVEQVVAAEAAKSEKKKRKHRKLVRRSHFMTIIAAWVITVPAAAVLSGMVFLLLNTFGG
ncbi:inorganic phosphate transporter [Amylibacter sp. IMCC11727]|uniref:inorganic phosphate transporter n=1 Tax=Amylibacter sp. IMCC11727 TaxID=3039851 RepID=UPI00244E08F4|nr:inorganic phosphate transporter [Amylibacter sp. IMCC11727]WGI20277.1 inorganic phosphate transporter [Amylibacter sp. IMCC11727]